ncbi:MAG: aminomethyltransferase family protein, partial [Chloroflexota bacterium]
FGCYANRFYPLSLGGDPLADYWHLRQKVMLYDVPEKPLEIVGPDALELLETIFTRKIGSLKIGRARYAIACTPQGGILMDGVLIRLAADRFWYVQADGMFEPWLDAHAAGLNVTVRDPHSWVLQIQGPSSLNVLQAAIDGTPLDSFGYFHAGHFDFDGQSLLVTRTGWTGEMGIEIYSGPETDHLALWDHLMQAGARYELRFGSLASMGIRRIEAGILDNGTDIDMHLTPFEAGLGGFVNFKKESFIGRAALLEADRRPLLLGVTSDTGVPQSGCRVYSAGHIVGKITAGDYSPTLEQGIGYVRFDAQAPADESWLGRSLQLEDHQGDEHACQVVPLPFYDKKKHIPKGMAE